MSHECGANVDVYVCGDGVALSARLSGQFCCMDHLWIYVYPDRIVDKLQDRIHCRAMWTMLHWCKMCVFLEQKLGPNRP